MIRRLLGTLLLLTGCLPLDTAPRATAVLPTQTPPPATLTVAPLTTDATPAGPLRLILWLPEPLVPVNNPAAGELLNTQLNTYQDEHSTPVELGWRRKRPQESGGILATLRTAAAVAPGALPDLTLLRRDDLLLAVEAGLVQPFDGRITSVVLSDLYPAALALGQVDGQLYGLPYTVDVLHLAYQGDTLQDWRFGDLLTRASPLVFPAGRSGRLNDLFYVQYLAAQAANGGALTFDPNGVDANALRATLRFYQEAVASGIIGPDLLDYGAPADYLTLPGDGAHVVDSTFHLQNPAFNFAPLPTADGAPITVLDGWMWVLTTPNADRQAQALEFLNWLFDTGRQSQYAGVVQMLPSQRSALRRMDSSAYLTFADTLLLNAVLPLSETDGGTAARAMQSALAAVLLGTRTADQATQDVLDQLSG